MFSQKGMGASVSSGWPASESPTSWRAASNAQVPDWGSQTSAGVAKSRSSGRFAAAPADVAASTVIPPRSSRLIEKSIM